MASCSNCGETAEGYYSTPYGNYNQCRSCAKKVRGAKKIGPPREGDMSRIIGPDPGVSF